MLGLNGTFRDLVILLASIPRFIRMFLSIKESEDCLYLNVYSPVVSAVLFIIFCVEIYLREPFVPFDSRYLEYYESERNVVGNKNKAFPPSFISVSVNFPL